MIMKTMRRILEMRIVVRCALFCSVWKENAIGLIRTAWATCAGAPRLTSDLHVHKGALHPGAQVFTATERSSCCVRTSVGSSIFCVFF